MGTRVSLHTNLRMSEIPVLLNAPQVAVLTHHAGELLVQAVSEPGERVQDIIMMARSAG